MTSVNLQEMYKAYKAEDEITTVPAAGYTLEVTRVGTRAGAKGPNITPVYRVVEGPYNGKSVMAGPMSLTEASRSIFFRNLKGFGLGSEFMEQAFASADPIKTIAEALKGRVVKAQLIIEPWNGEDRNKLVIGAVSLVSVGSGIPGIPGAPALPAPPATAAPPPLPASPQGAVPQAPAPVYAEPAQAPPVVAEPAQAYQMPVEQAPPLPVPAAVPVTAPVNSNAPPPPPPPIPGGQAPRSF